MERIAGNVCERMRTLDGMTPSMREPRVPYFPLVVDEEFEQERQVAAHGTLGALSLLGSMGIATANREPMVVIVAEIPNMVRPPMDKSAQELRDLLDFARREVPSVEDDALAPGPDPNAPPDAVLELPQGAVRLEAAQIHVPATNTMGTNMSRWAIFERLRASLISRSAVLAGALRRHRGFVIYVWFTDPTGDGVQFALPPRQDPSKGLVDLLVSSRPSEPVRGVTDRLPSTAPGDAVVWSEDRQVGISWADLPSGYQSPFMRAFGFEIGLAGSISFKQSNVRAELCRIIKQHDTPASDVLVVSANSALRSGLHFPSTQLVSDMLFEDPDPLQGWLPDHLGGVALHDPREGHEVRWLTGSLGYQRAATISRLAKSIT
jgi:hypothetical protein